ncbi:MAG: DUF3108 domain-containing protein [Rhodospirillales bacterium]|nr:DUF3108 domain-containing protein [Rhodospirillales bacterium]
MRVLAAFAVFLLLAPPSHAGTIEGRYVASWAGLPAGEIEMRIDDDGADYRGRLDIRTEGLPRWLTRFKGTVVSEGRFAPDGTARPRRYDAHYDLRKRKDKLNSLRFVPKAGALVAERGPGDTSKKPPIAEDFRRGVIDPLSALVAVRHRILTGRLDPGGRFVLPVFDGSRRFDAEGTAARRDGRIHVSLLLKPIAGFGDDRPDEDEDPENSPREVRIELTDDGRLVPVRLEVMIAWLPAVVRLAG